MLTWLIFVMAYCCHGWLLSWLTAVMVNCCHGWLLSWLTAFVIDCCHVWLMSWFTTVMVDCCHGLLLSWLTAVMVEWCHGWLLSWLTDVKVDCRHGWLLSWLTAGMVDCCHGWLLSWLTAVIWFYIIIFYNGSDSICIQRSQVTECVITTNQCWLNNGPPSVTLTRHCTTLTCERHVSGSGQGSARGLLGQTDPGAGWAGGGGWCRRPPVTMFARPQSLLTQPLSRPEMLLGGTESRVAMKYQLSNWKSNCRNLNILIGLIGPTDIQNWSDSDIKYANKLCKLL